MFTKNSFKILFVCTGNSARSQIAEGFARYYGGDRVHVESAGTNPKGVSPFAVWAMNEAGIDISQHTSDCIKSHRLDSFDLVITVCSAARDTCPVLPPHVKTEHWSIPDPIVRTRDAPILIRNCRVIRYQIERKVIDLLRRVLET